MKLKLDTPRRPLHKGSTPAEWEEAARRLNKERPKSLEPWTGETLRTQVLHADEIIEKLLLEEASLKTDSSTPKDI